MASAGVRRVLVALLVPFALITVVGAVWVYPFGHESRTGAEIGLDRVPVRGEVVSVVSEPCGGLDPGQPGQPDQPGRPGQPGQQACVTVSVRMTDGAAAGETIPVAVISGPSMPRYTVGDEVVLAYSGSEPRAGESYELVDFQRGVPLVLLAVLFAAAVLLLGRWKGLAALGAMALSFVVLLVLVLPAILAGEDPLLVALVGAGLIMFMALYVTHGFSARTSTAVLGTMVSLGLIGVLGFGFAALTRLTGLDEDTSNLVGLLGGSGVELDTRGLLLASVVIGALGVLDDVTVTQTSAVWELRRANPALGWQELASAGLRIGRDHVSSVVNTLVMAYTGAALPLLLALSISGRGLADIVTAQQVSQEVVRTLVGSIGLVAAVPLTTVLAAVVAAKQEPESGRRPAKRAAGTGHRRPAY